MKKYLLFFIPFLIFPISSEATTVYCLKNYQGHVEFNNPNNCPSYHGSIHDKLTNQSLFGSTSSIDGDGIDEIDADPEDNNSHLYILHNTDADSSKLLENREVLRGAGYNDQTVMTNQGGGQVLNPYNGQAQFTDENQAGFGGGGAMGSSMNGQGYYPTNSQSNSMWSRFTSNMFGGGW